ncbi:putative transposase (plasmid) [Rhodococcus opacus B4]|uniref:Putative transposase n=1 Tax=Rhodococcus opacus (strain B4) TaxID=632772 RepID=C1BDP5_RHOOB|nr:putative transposase [Rhodococcus opacus B4]
MRATSSFRPSARTPIIPPSTAGAGRGQGLPGSGPLGQFVYLWVDGIHLKVRLEQDKLCRATRSRTHRLSCMDRRSAALSVNLH